LRGAVVSLRPLEATMRKPGEGNGVQGLENIAGTRVPDTNPQADRWAVILAGGDGTRLLPLTRRITGDETPKQFCALTGRETLLEETRRRVRDVVPERNSLILVTQTHQRYFRHQIDTVPPENLLIQPFNRGTAPAIAYALMHMKDTAPRAIVSFFPSDHHFRNSQAFAAYADQAYEHAEACCEKVVLLGIAAETAEEAYGWIEPGGRLRRGAGGDLFEVRRFREKPSKEAAVRLMAAGCLWNSFVMVGRVSAFLKLMRLALPRLLAAFETPPRIDIAEVYGRIDPANFSHDVLSISPSRLAVLPVEHAGWTDLGEPERVINALRDGLGYFSARSFFDEP
jgi:mannose-1-phosphate guanylyltransferase